MKLIYGIALTSHLLSISAQPSSNIEWIEVYRNQVPSCVQLVLEQKLSASHPANQDVVETDEPSACRYLKEFDKFLREVQVDCASTEPDGGGGFLTVEITRWLRESLLHACKKEVALRVENRSEQIPPTEANAAKNQPPPPIQRNMQKPLVDQSSDKEVQFRIHPDTNEPKKVANFVNIPAFEGLWTQIPVCGKSEVLRVYGDRGANRAASSQSLTAGEIGNICMESTPASALEILILAGCSGDKQTSDSVHLLGPIVEYDRDSTVSN